MSANLRGDSVLMEKTWPLLAELAGDHREARSEQEKALVVTTGFPKGDLTLLRIACAVVICIFCHDKIPPKSIYERLLLASGLR